jgi:hypothetical protein
VVTVAHGGGVTGRRAPVLLLVVIGIGVVALAAQQVLSRLQSGGSSIPVAPGQVRIVLYGDSLATQAEAYIRAAVSAHHKAALEYKSFLGTAICDWLHDMATTAKSFHPRAVLMEFSGDSLTPCMRDHKTGGPLAGAALVAKYRTDADKAMSIFTRPTVYWVGAPPTADPVESAIGAQVRAVYEALPGSFPKARYVDAGAAVTDRGSYTPYLPCLSFEPCLGPRQNGLQVNQVRSPDGIHFCPIQVKGSGNCPVYASGAFRFAAAMAAPLIVDLGL